jgi:CheY-like chemotaxis protein
VVWNLLSNAVKFTEPEGRIVVTVDQTGAGFRISVRDTGRGIAPDFLPFVFDRFRQEDSSTTRQRGGLGLGLSIVRHLVELHGGQVEVESGGLGRGALFRVFLPSHAPSPPQDAGEKPAAEDEPRAPLPTSPIPSLTELRVLLVEDDEDSRELLGEILAGAGAVVQTASSAADGYAALAAFRPDVLISDIGMPGEDGFSFIRRVRALGADRGGALPAIALTAYTRAQDQTKALAAGFTSHVGKPVDPSDLLAALANLAALIER